MSDRQMKIEPIADGQRQTETITDRQRQIEMIADRVQGRFPLSYVRVWRDLVDVHVPGHDYVLVHGGKGWKLECDDSTIVSSKFPLKPTTTLMRNLQNIYKKGNRWVDRSPKK